MQRMPTELTRGRASPRRSPNEATGACSRSPVRIEVNTSKAPITKNMAASGKRLRDGGGVRNAISQAQAIALNAKAARSSPLLWRRSAPRVSAALSAITKANGKIAVTVSVGVAGRAQEHANAAELFSLADEALYAAKKAGRNRVVATASRL